MRIAVGSDMDMPVVRVTIDELVRKGHTVTTFGAIVTENAPWPKVAIEAAEAVATGACHQAILFCWTGTGISIAANKVRGIRAALCTDAETARGARQWNDANVLCMSLRLTSEVIAKEILEAWFAAEPSKDPVDAACIVFLKKAEDRLMKSEE